MKRNHLVKFALLALFTVIILAAIGLFQKNSNMPNCTKCCMEVCTPAPAGGHTDFLFYESIGHPIAATFKQ